MSTSNAKIIQIPGFQIGGERTFVIAEIGSNHNQSLELAYETIDSAKDCGADAVKFQSINIDKLYLDPGKEVIELHKKIDLAEEWHVLLKNYCDKKGIIFFSSPTYMESIPILEQINVPLYKLASAQIGTFPQLVRKVIRTGKPVILSTGLVNHEELKQVVRIFKEEKNDQFIILHCNSIYPTPFNRVNLGLMDLYAKEFGCIVGFSDHTPDIFIPIAAVARGAKVIEKHFALNRTLPVPDAAISLIPAEFKRMVEGIRAAEQAMGNNPRPEIEKEELSFKNKIRTRLVLAGDKKPGELVKEADFIFRRSAEGIDCLELDNILEHRAAYSKNVVKGALLSENDLAGYKK